jgi:hypothetical protein
MFFCPYALFVKFASFAFKNFFTIQETFVKFSTNSQLILGLLTTWNPRMRLVRPKTERIDLRNLYL